MSVMVFLKCAGDVSFLFMMLGSIAVHFGAPVWVCVVTLACICLAEVLSFILDGVKKEIRFLPLILPLGCIFLPGTTVSWGVICGIIYAYTVFVSISRRYMAGDSQRTILKINAGALVAMLLILLMIEAKQVSYSIVMFAGLISLCCCILLLRSLRHEPEVYAKTSYQLVNLAVMAAVIGLSVLLSTKAVLNGIFTVIKAIYQGIAYVLVSAVTLILRGLAAAAGWIASLFAGSADAEKKVDEITLDMRSASDLFDNVSQQGELPTWIKVVGIVIITLVVLGIIVLIFRKLAGKREGRENVFSGSRASYSQTYQRAGSDNAALRFGGVRKQYRKYLAMVQAEGATITADETSADIERTAPEKYRTDAAAELRRLYIKARYNGESSDEAVNRAKELVRLMKK